MERLTERYPNNEKKGIAGIKVFESENKIPIVKVLSGEYLYPAIEKLATYEDLEEQGLLVRLPCKLGDTVWVVTSPINVINVFDYDKYDGDNLNVYINQNCMITTPFDMIANQIVEENRGKNKHGSCGLGVFETIKRYRAGVTDLDYNIKEYYLEQFKKEDIELSGEWLKIFFDNGIFEHFLEDLDFMNSHSLCISDEYFLNQYDNIIFEAAQGLLLDQNNIDYFPHLTPSNYKLPDHIDFEFGEFGWECEEYEDTYNKNK